MSIDPVDAPALRTARLTLEPLRIAHAEEMAPLLADPELYAFTGGTPPTLDELRVRYAGQVSGRSPDGLERWLNWIVRRRQDGQAVGFVQAAIAEDPPPVTAVLAWVLGTAFQGHGYAREATQALAAWLESVGVGRLVAYINDAHEASMGVARALGMAPTDARVDGEVVWARATG
jgi:RimJ/RimL family protein N-acetyltransferase